MTTLPNRVRISTSYPGYEGRPVVLVDGEPLKAVSRIEIDHDYGERASVVVRLTIIGVDVDMEAAPEWVARVIGPSLEAQD